MKSDLCKRRAVQKSRAAPWVRRPVVADAAVHVCASLVLHAGTAWPLRISPAALPKEVAGATYAVPGSIFRNLVVTSKSSICARIVLFSLFFGASIPHRTAPFHANPP
jgi:hypothetical protein